jgi:hypothetical protein
VTDQNAMSLDTSPYPLGSRWLSPTGVRHWFLAGPFRLTHQDNFPGILNDRRLLRLPLPSLVIARSSGCHLRPTATTTTQRGRPLTSIQTNSASWHSMTVADVLLSS